MSRATVASAPTLEDLQQLVHTTLCAHDRLDAEQAPLRRALIRRRGRPCGMVFQIEGPRLLRTYAVWSGDEHRVLFYDSAGLRFAEVLLSEGPESAEPAAVLPG